MEGLPGQEIVLTSLQDDRYGAGGTFQTNSSDLKSMLPDEPEPGDWGGIHIGPVARGSIDYAVIAFGGGLTRVEGSFAAFNAVEWRQGLLRLTDSLLDHNDDGPGTGRTVALDEVPIARVPSSSGASADHRRQHHPEHRRLSHAGDQHQCQFLERGAG